MKKQPKPIRVTEVLDFCNSAWKEWWWRSVGFKTADAIGKESAGIGTKVHKIIEDHLKGCLVIEQHEQDHLELAHLVIEWLQKEGIKPLYVEQTLEDKRLNLIGHTDLIAEKDGEHLIVDWKTSNKHRKEFPLQKAAYAKMANKQLKLNINKGITVRIDKETHVVDVRVYEDLVKKYWPPFLSCLKVYKFFK